MKKYMEAVETLFKLNSTALIPNSDQEHAVVLIANIFKHAVNHVCVYCDNAIENVFGDSMLRNSIQAAIERGVMIRFLTDQKITPSYLNDLIKENKIEWRQNDSDNFKTQHFVEADEKAFRIEENHETAQAIGCANNAKLGAKLHELFSEMWTMAS